MTKLIKAAEIKRPTSNLVPDISYQLDRAQMKTGFMGVFTWAYPGASRRTLLKIALAPLMNTSVIPVTRRASAKNAEQRKQRRDENQKLRAWEEKRKKIHLGHFTKLKKINGENPYFELHLPVLSFSDVADIDAVFFIFGGAGMTDDARQEAEQILDSKSSTTFNGALALSRSGLPGQTQDIFKSTLLGVQYEFGSVQNIAYLVFKISKEEAEALVSTDWMEIRPADLYPLMSMWVEAEFISKFYSKSLVSLSRIASTLPRRPYGKHRSPGRLADVSGKVPQECRHGGGSGAWPGGFGKTFAEQVTDLTCG
jgi:hypothetical protein